jgi:hypothetical protein
MLKTRTKVRATLAIAALVAVASFWGGWPEFRDDDGDYPADRAPDERGVTLTLSWTPAATRKPGHINARGWLAGPFKTEGPYSPSPFVENGTAHRGDKVEVHGEAVDGPFLSFDCSITGTGVVEVKKTIWAGLRAYCSAVLA